jgi:hypothetical protein
MERSCKRTGMVNGCNAERLRTNSENSISSMFSTDYLNILNNWHKNKWKPEQNTILIFSQKIKKTLRLTGSKYPPHTLPFKLIL